MNCFIMKAVTLDGEWFEFTMANIPTLIDSDTFVLMGLPGSPIMKFSTIKRGDWETGLYEGDVIQSGGDNWVVCYERGFQIINADYVVRHLYHIDDWEVIDSYDNGAFIVPITVKKKHLFKYNDTVFRFNDIVGAYDGNLIIRCCKGPVPCDEVKQTCGLRKNGTMLYLGNLIDRAPIELRGGRLTICKDNKIIDVATGGVLNGYNPRNSR